MLNSRKIEDLKPLAQKACRLFLAECAKQGLNVCITQTLRDAEYQYSLYQKGRTVKGSIVTWCDGYKKKSNHQSGMAWDICKNVRGQEYSDAKFFEQCGKIAKKLGITWGGTWKTPDRPHFEIDSKWKYEEEEEEVKVEKDKIIVDGKEHTVQMIRHEGVTYIKTRDVANAIGLDVSSKGRIPVLTTKK